MMLLDLITERINRAYAAREVSKTEWSKIYWYTVISYLLREANRLT